MSLHRDTELYRADVRSSYTLLTPSEREALIKPYLPAPLSNQNLKSRSKPIREFLLHQLHVFIYSVIHLLFSIFIRTRTSYRSVKDRFLSILYYHHRTPALIRRDIAPLERLPRHLSVILDGTKGIDGLLDDVAELSAWCACVGIPLLSVYEKSGLLKSYVPQTHKVVVSRLNSYFGPQRPTLQVKAPHMRAFLNGDELDIRGKMNGGEDPGHLSLLLLSSEDGRPTLVDLTKTLADMSQHGKLDAEDISIDLIDAELTESTAPEPDVLFLFGRTAKLEGFPPWQLRLTEIIHVSEHGDVGYLNWLKGLFVYAKAEMRFGR